MSCWVGVLCGSVHALDMYAHAYKHERSAPGGTSVVTGPCFGSLFEYPELRSIMANLGP
jgi:hypothetical protein